ncbi:MAG TPA: ATP-binding cassette domain-containing protein [Gammaproteobacteria bacterium]|nr:ATP-binding cassette domain-containing protein [Gammaproteobacteria bacterium]
MDFPPPEYPTKPIKDLSLSFPHKTCFDDFNIHIRHGSRIAIIGRNGSGKTTLLKMLQGELEPTSGIIECGTDVVFGCVPQIIENFDSLSGGQRFNEALTHALCLDPNVLLLDEPTNHLDRQNRTSLMRLLKSYSGTLIVVSHDTELLRYCMDTLWHVDNGQIQVFSGNYDDYICAVHSLRASIEKELIRLERQKKDMHHALMKEQKRAAKSKTQGEKNIHQKKWPTVVSAAKASRAEETSGRKKSVIDNKKQRLNEELAKLRLPEIIVPKFSISAAELSDRMIISISDGCIGYTGTESLLQKIRLSMRSKERIAIQGDNASGKSTLIKAILGDVSVIKSGNWIVPKRIDIGYLDQHYGTLSAGKTVCETIAERVTTWSYIEVRRLLNDFLFRKNEEVNTEVSRLSGGEKVRLTLAQIAAFTPKLLILDEITNNLDLETRGHVIEVLKNYPGAMIIISHDVDFLKEIGVSDGYEIVDGYFSFSAR